MSDIKLMLMQQKTALLQYAYHVVQQLAIAGDTAKIVLCNAHSMLLLRQHADIQSDSILAHFVIMRLIRSVTEHRRICKIRPAS